MKEHIDTWFLFFLPVLDIVANLLGQDAKIIERALTSRTVTAGSAFPGRRGSSHAVPLDVEKVKQEK